MKKKIIITLCLVVFLYLSMAFILLSVDPTDWSYDNRLAFVLMVLFITGITLTFPKDFNL